MNIQKEEKIIKKNTIFTLIINVILSVVKMVAGILGHSTVLISDAINSLGDVGTNIIVYISAKFSRKGVDSKHPYGYEKYESIISIFLGIAIIYSAYEVGLNAIRKLYDYFVNGVRPSFIPAWYALLVAIVTIIIKEYLFRKTKKDAKIARSSALMAQAWDHRSDTIVSFGAVIGIVGAMLGYSYLELIASIIIAVFIFILGYKIIVTGVSQVVDKSAGTIICNRIKEVVKKHKEVKRLDEVKTRMFGMKLYVDMEIGLDYNLSLEEAHEIAERVHKAVEDEIPEIIHCMIHVNPYFKKM